MPESAAVKRESSSIRSVLVGLVKLVPFAIVLALTLELSARWYLFGFAGLDPQRIGSVKTLMETELVRVSEHPELGWELAPSASGFHKLVHLQTNSQGLRDREYPLATPSGTFRVAVIGSSFTLPAGVAIESAFHSLLEQYLSTESRPVEFLNFAVGGYGTRQELAMLRLRALDYDPDLVVFALTQLSAPSIRSVWNEPIDFDGLEEPRSAAFDCFACKLMRVRTGLLEIEPEPDSVDPESSGVDVLAKLAELSRATGIPIVLLRLGMHDRPPSPLEVEIEREARQLGLHYLDTRPVFAGHRPSNFWIHPVDGHPNAAAHAIFADTLGVFLRDQGLLAVESEASIR